MKPVTMLPIPVKRALLKLGKDIKDARIRRRITMELMAQRAFISRTTLTKVEKGDPSVALGIYATVLFILGMVERLTNLADLTIDEIGQTLDEARMPKRVRLPARKREG